jgi:hypothetical protein
MTELQRPQEGRYVLPPPPLLLATLNSYKITDLGEPWGAGHTSGLTENRPQRERAAQGQPIPHSLFLPKVAHFQGEEHTRVTGILPGLQLTSKFSDFPDIKRFL